MNVELTIKGKVESLHLEEGDRILVTFDSLKSLSSEDIERVKSAIEDEFPGHEVLCLYGLSLAREEA